MQSPENVLYFNKGALVGVPKAGAVGLLFDASGNAFTLDENGNRKAVGVAADPGTRVKALADQGALDFTGLTGATDGGYLVEGVWLAGAAGDHDLIVQLNAVTTGYTTALEWANTVTPASSNVGNFGAGANAAGFALARAGNDASRNAVFFRFTVSPSNGTDQVMVSGTATTFATATGNAGNPAGIQFAGIFLPGGPITEIKLLRSDANATGILQNSWARIQKTGLTA